MPENKISLSIIVPVFNEEKNIGELYTRLKSAAESITGSYEIIFVNDGSKDSSIQLISAISLSNPKVNFISFSRNFGHQVAISAGLEHSNGDAVVIIDGDLQDPPELIPKLYEEYLKGNKVVCAKRVKRNGETLFKKATAKGFYRLLKYITEIDIPIDTGDFRLIDKEVVNLLANMPEPNKFLRGQIAWLGFKTVFVEFERKERKGGKTGYPVRKMIKLAFDGITAFSNTPLKLATALGFIVSGIAFIIILYALYVHLLLGKTITGWTSIIISTMFIGGIQLLAIGIIGEYISRINSNVRKRQLYIVEKTNIRNKQNTGFSIEKVEGPQFSENIQL